MDETSEDRNGRVSRVSGLFTVKGDLSGEMKSIYTATCSCGHQWEGQTFEQAQDSWWECERSQHKAAVADD